MRNALARTVRLAQLGAVSLATGGLEKLRRKGKDLEIRLDGLNQSLDVKPIADIPWPRIDLAQCDDPVAAVLASPEFQAATHFFQDNPVAQRSLVSSQSQALLYAILRNLRPDHVFEIGCYKAGTTEALSRALHANGHGTVHTVDPFRGEYVSAVLKHWPPQLMDRVRLYPMNSMSFFMEMERRKIHPDLVFVDGNHDYEFALFDISRGARYLKQGGFIFVDNIAQAGPFYAGRDFLAASPGWREHGTSTQTYSRAKAFDRKRTTIAETDFMVLRSPQTYVVGETPANIGRVRWWSHNVSGLQLQLAGVSGTGTLDVQIVFRGFGPIPVEKTGEARIELNAASGEITVPVPVEAAGQFTHFSIEPWLSWRGDRPLQLTSAPKPF